MSVTRASWPLVASTCKVPSKLTTTAGLFGADPTSVGLRTTAVSTSLS